MSNPFVLAVMRAFSKKPAPKQSDPPVSEKPSETKVSTPPANDKTSG